MSDENVENSFKDSNIHYKTMEASAFNIDQGASYNYLNKGKSTQQLVWSLSNKSRVSTMQRNSYPLHKRLSSSHNSISDLMNKKVDDSIFITQAMSHNMLNDTILDFYNVPLDSDIYTAPIDFINNHCNLGSKLHGSNGEPESFQKNDRKIHRRSVAIIQHVDCRKHLIAKTSHMVTNESRADHKRRVPNKMNGCNGKINSFSCNLKQKLCSIFRITKHQQYLRNKKSILDNHKKQNVCCSRSTAIEECYKKYNVSKRKLPPLPTPVDKIVSLGVSLEGIGISVPEPNEKTPIMDFTASIDKVKERGWYWGPISSEGAEKILSNEPDGSFLVRDSSDDHYIFSLTFKLNGSVRHVRIDQDQGAFSFGSCVKFKSHTIMEFIENAVEHSLSGRYLFFLHRRPEHGPLRVQLTKPVSRFKHVQSLQHLCRFVIHKTIIRKDFIQTLPLPRRILDYLNYKNCLSERIEIDMIS